MTKRLACYRPRSEIIYSMLRAVKDERSMTHTQIMYASRLSYSQLKDYMTLLVGNALIVKLEDRYMITQRGIEYIDAHEEMDLMLCLKDDEEIEPIKRDYK